MSTGRERNDRSTAPPDAATAVRRVAASLVEDVAAAYRRRAATRAALVAVAGASALAAGVLLWDAGPGVGSALRPLAATLPVAGLFLLAAAGLTAALRPRPRSAFVRLIEERAGLAERLSTALEARLEGPLGAAFAAEAAPRLAAVRVDDVAPWRIRRPGLAALIAAATLGLAMLVAGGPARIAERWGMPADATDGGRSTVGRGAAPDRGERPAIAGIRWSARSPAYAGGSTGEGEAPDPVRALVGSRVVVRAEVRGGGRLSARLLGGDALPDQATPADAGTIVWRLRDTDRALEFALSTADGIVDRRILPLDPVRDAPPRVELEAPARDMTLAEGRGELDIRAAARDDHGLAAFEVRWIRSRGSGESYSFDEGVLPWTTVGEGAEARRGRARLDLASLDLGPGDVLHLRAVARDANPAAGGGEGVSETRTVRIARADEEALVDAVLTLPIEAEENPILSQRMLILLTERLLRNAPAGAAFGAEATRIGEEQARLRGRVGEVIFSRTGDGSEDAPPDPFAPPEDVFGGDPGADEHGQDEDFDPLDPADVLAAANRATGTGNEDELAHRHDESAILSIDQDLLDAYNAMWDAERELRQAAARPSLPHQHRALDLLQKIRAGERVFSRARVTLPPVDVAGARGSGDLEGVAPGPRRTAAPLTAGADPAAAIENALRRWDALAPEEAGLLATDVAAALFADPGIDARAGALAVRAADRARAGALGDGRRALAEALRLVAPPRRTGGPAPPAAGQAPAFYDALANSDPGSGDPPSRAPSAGRFVFATARYASGDWDSAPLVPANLTHSVAQYTSIPVAAEPVTVDLASREVFRYPFLFLTGHLPVHFTGAERDNVRAYVERGGLLFIDDHNHDIDAAFHRSIVGEIERIFGAGSLVDLPADHELYRSFFVFRDGPPTTAHELNGWGDGLIHETLRTVLVGERIGVLYSNKDYASQWNYHAQNKRFNAIDDTRFGVNVIVYALTR